MRLGELWLRGWVNPAIDSDALASQITMAGLEADGAEPAAGSLHGVIADEVIRYAQHPNAGKLRATKVNVGDDRPLDTVYDVPSCRQSLRMAVVITGAVLPGDFKIKVAKLYGGPSEGMLCFFSELGISGDHNSTTELPTDTPISTDVCEYLRLGDSIIEISVTPNRADCLGIIGVVRDVVVLSQLPLVEPEIVLVGAIIDDTLSIAVEASDACLHYLGRVIKGINARAPTPLRIKEKLRCCRIRSIDTAVNATDYVLLELGQSMYVFDEDHIEGDIMVWMAKEGETLVLLDSTEMKLNADALVIAGHNETLVMGSIFDGERSGVNNETRNVLLERAFFSPLSIAGRTRRHGLHTNVSHRYEHGVGPVLQHKTMERATCLLIDICSDEAGPVVGITNEATLPKCTAITLRRSKLDRLIGHHITDEQVTDIPCHLGCKVTGGRDE